jgi:Cu(I)/Ag(I) efflux system membrane protein CusA/SilA
MRRGVGELDGKGEVVGGVVIMRYGENAQKVIENTKEKLNELKSTLPPGVKLVTTYDRSELIDRAVDNLRHTLIEELIIVSIVIMIFLWDLRSAIVPIITIPVTVILAFIPMQAMGMTANIMSLGGLAVAIGALVDASVVMVEQTHKKLEHWEAEGRPGLSHAVVIAAVKEVGGPSFFALLHARRPGRPSLQTACIHQEFLNGDCGIARDYTGPCSDALPVFAYGRLHVPPHLACKNSQRDFRWQDP